jgi:hypothetical protein
MESSARVWVKVFLRGERRATTCKWCGRPVIWLKVVKRTDYILFNQSAVPLGRGKDRVTGEPVEFYDKQDCHWLSCASKPEGQHADDGRPAAASTRRGGAPGSRAT